MDLNNNIMMGSFTADQMQTAKLRTGRLALLDADRIKYVVTHRIYKIKKENQLAGRDDIYLKEPLYITEARKWIHEWLDKIDDPIVFCFSDSTGNNFRTHLASEKEYKGSRKDKVDQYDYEGKFDDMKNIGLWVIENYSTLLAKGLEADDIVSALQDPDNTYIISNDKDLKQVPGWHYNEGTNQIEYVDDLSALKHICKQLITGDATDDIQGVYRKGPKFAENFINNPNNNPRYYMQLVLELYQKSYNSITKGTEAFCENFMLIKMKSDRGDYFKKKYAHLFDTKEMLLQKMREQQLMK